MKNINKVNFDTYIHLQNKKITELQNAINTFPTKAQLNAPIKSIKNISTSKLQLAFKSLTALFV